MQGLLTNGSSNVAGVSLFAAYMPGASTCSAHEATGFHHNCTRVKYCSGIAVHNVSAYVVATITM